MSTAVVPAALAGEVMPAGGQASELDEHRAAFLLGYRNPNTRDAYERDLEWWLTFCRRYNVDPIRATKQHTGAWLTELSLTPLPRTGKPPEPATLARRVAVLSSWFEYLLDVDVIDAVPIRKSTRPKPPRESPTVGLTIDEATALEVRCLEHEHAREAALVIVLRYTGLRVSELTEANLGALRPEEGHTVLLVDGKGGQKRKVPLAGPAQTVLEVYLERRAAEAGVGLAELLERVDEPLITTAAGGRWNRRSVTRSVQRIARAAGVTSWAHLSPHSLRHALATNLLDEGAGLDVVQDLLGHASPETTRRYDRARGKVSRLAAGLARLTAATEARKPPAPPAPASSSIGTGASGLGPHVVEPHLWDD